jgi:YD repeat-containing protein
MKINPVALVSGSNYKWMKSLLGLLILISLGSTAWAQHYYNDILLTEQNRKKQELYRQNKVKAVKTSAFDAEGKSIEGFSSDQTVSADFREIRTTTITTLTGTSESTSYYNENGQLIKSIDTTEGLNNTITYSYDPSGKIVRILNISASPGDFRIKEEHLWTYDSKGRPARMVRIRNDKDSSFVSFSTDEKGNIAIEKIVERGRESRIYYYYYDDKNRLTDIVRYNNKAGRLLPDYLFEYDDEGRLSTMTVVPEGTGDYQKWFYSYFDEGLKGQDACYSKSKVLIARVEYAYQHLD